MLRQVIKIDENKCNGCGECVLACHEGAIKIIDGKAKLIRDDYCDGLGNCLPVCPVDAICFETREADEFDEEAVKQHMNKEENSKKHFSCPSSAAKEISHLQENKPAENINIPSSLNQWPVQLKLVPTTASYFNDADLLIAADCSAFTYGNFHQDFMKDKVTIIGCPKLDEGDYSEKLTQIFKNNNIKTITVAIIEVPCCTGLLNAVKTAIKNSGIIVPWSVSVIGTNGEIIK